MQHTVLVLATVHYRTQSMCSTLVTVPDKAQSVCTISTLATQQHRAPYVCTLLQRSTICGISVQTSKVQSQCQARCHWWLFSLGHRFNSVLLLLARLPSVWGLPICAEALNNLAEPPLHWDIFTQPKIYHPPPSTSPAFSYVQQNLRQIDFFHSYQCILHKLTPSKYK